MSVIDNDAFRKLLRKHPSDAVEHLFEVYHKTLLRIALKFTRDREVAADVVQETFMLVWTKRKELSNDHEMPIERFLVRVVRNKSITSFTKNIRHVSFDNVTAFRHNGFPADGINIEKNIIDAEISQQLRKVISTFPSREQECLLMRIDEQMSVEEIAVRLQVTRKAVERSFTSANKRLRKWAEKNPL